LGPGTGKRAVRHLNLPATPSSATRSSEVDSVQMASLPAKKAARYLQIENEYRMLMKHDLAATIPLVP